MRVPLTAQVTKTRMVLIVGLFSVFAFGLGLRIWMITQPMGVLDSDMAVLGLMAQQAQDFHLSIFHWGQYYGGAQETYLAALLGIFTGVNKVVLQLTTIVLAFTACVALGLATKEVVNGKAALLATMLFWLWPGPFVWWSIKIGSNYWFALTVALLAVFALARLREQTITTGRFAVLGILVGLTVWSNPQAAYILVPAFVAFRMVIWNGRKQLHWLVTGFVIGAAPWLFSVLTTDFQPLKPAGGTAGDLDRGVPNFFTDLVPQVIGLKVPFDGRWLFGNLGVVLTVAFGFLVLAAPLFLKKGERFPWVALMAGSVLFVTTQWALYQSHPRYLFWLMPWFLMVVSGLLARVPTHFVVTVAAALLLAGTTTTAQAVVMNKSPLVGYSARDVALPTDDSQLVTLLKDNAVNYAYADYWLAYKTTFETQIKVAPYYTDRYPPLTNEVNASGRPAYIFMTDSLFLNRFLDYCRTIDAVCKLTTNGPYALVQPDRLITSEDVSTVVGDDIPNELKPKTQSFVRG